MKSSPKALESSKDYSSIEFIGEDGKFAKYQDNALQTPTNTQLDRIWKIDQISDEAFLDNPVAANNKARDERKTASLKCKVAVKRIEE